MASSLQLFANYENTFNSSLFYRLTSASPYNFTLRLNETNPDIANSYIAEYVIDGGSNRVLFDDNLTASIQISAQTPGVHTISVTAFNDQSYNQNIQVISMSAVIVSSFLSAHFLSYPQGFITPLYPKYRYNTTYASESAYFADLQTNGSGNSFIGEGHSESVALSTNSLFAGCSAVWKVGPYNAITTQPLTSVVINSTSNASAVYPVSLQVSNSTFLSSGPVVAYFESLSGAPSYYPFYSSSVTPSGTENLSNSTFNRSLSVLKYPESSPSEYSFVPPFSGSINLPLDSSSQLFVSNLVNLPYDNSIFTEQFGGSIWNVNAIANPQGINPDWSFTTNTLSASILNFRFQLSYHDDDNIDNVLLKASVGYPTTININASAVKLIQMTYRTGSDRFGSSWLARAQYVPFQATATILPLPVSNLYTPNYYNLTGTDVFFTNIWSNSSLLAQPASTTISYNNQSVSLSGLQSGSIHFGPSDVGIVELSANTSFLDAYYIPYNKSYFVSDICEVVQSFDDVELNHYHTNESPFVVTHKSAPKISPNEWAVADNVNSIFKKFGEAIDELNEYSSLYTLSSTKVTGRLERTYNQPGYTTGVILTSQSSLSGSVLTLLGSPVQTLNIPLSTIVTFGATLSSVVTNYYAPFSIPVIPGYVYTWVVPSVDPIAFSNWTVPSADSTLYYTGALVLPQSQRIVVSYQNYLSLIENQYKARAIDTEVSIDEIFEFQNIQAVGVTSTDYITVLDSVIPRVSVYTITNNNFTLFSTWGGFGSYSSKQGFNKPQDLHIDSQDLVWIADTGNNCIKKFTINGKNLLIFTHDLLQTNTPLSVCVDSAANVHVLTANMVVVFDSTGSFLFSYDLPSDIYGVKKINTSFNRETIYITHMNGVIKFFKNGTLCYRPINNKTAVDGSALQGYTSVYQDKFRNLYVTLKDQIIRVVDLMKLERYKAQSEVYPFWSINDLLIDKDEYIQPWVYIKSFHRLWDNIEIFRNSLFYNNNRRAYVPPTFSKNDIVIGQNEIVTNAVINRISNQLWTNLESIISYFNPITPVLQTAVVPSPAPAPIFNLTDTTTTSTSSTTTTTVTSVTAAPNDGIVAINDNSIYFTSSTGVYMVSGARAV